MSRDQRRGGRVHPGSVDEPGCSGKVRYLTVGEAFSYGRVSRGVLEGAKILRAYECERCGKWHLTALVEVPRFELEETTVSTSPKPNMLTVAFTLPKKFNADDLAPALERARAAGALVFGDVDLRSHVSFPHPREGGVDVALVSVHPSPIAPDAVEEEA